LEPLGVRAGIEKAVCPTVTVTKRLCDTLQADGERPQDGRPGGLDTGDWTVVSGAERKRDEHERHEHEDAHDKTPPEWASAA
jgi:hypothetical protein